MYVIVTFDKSMAFLDVSGALGFEYSKDKKKNDQKQIKENLKRYNRLEYVKLAKLYVHLLYFSANSLCRTCLV